MEHSWTYSAQDALAYYDVTLAKGLTDGQVQKGLAKYGPNGKFR